MFNHSKDPQQYDCRLKPFLEDNLSIITIIGVFGALSFFSINDSDQDLKLISVLLSIIVIFLFIYVLFDGIRRIWYNIIENFSSKNFIDYATKCKILINLIIFLTLLSLFVCLLIFYLNLHAMLDFRVLLLLIISFIDLIILAITIPYILIKENDIKNIGKVWALLFVILSVVSLIVLFFNPTILKSPPQSNINSMISTQSFFILLIFDPMVIWLVALAKMLLLIIWEKSAFSKNKD